MVKKSQRSLRTLPKGQEISEATFLGFNSSKKPKDFSPLFLPYPQKWGIFERNWSHKKIASEITWPSGFANHEMPIVAFQNTVREKKIPDWNFWRLFSRLCHGNGEYHFWISVQVGIGRLHHRDVGSVLYQFRPTKEMVWEYYRLFFVISTYFVTN